jgi:hypothetical protein
MKKEKPSAFSEARPRTPKAAALMRERVTMNAMQTLTAVADEAKFKEMLTTIYQLKPGQPQYEAALRAWREAQALR